MGVYEGRGQLTRAIKDLLLRWGEVSVSWRDSRAEDFHKRTLEPLEMDVRNATSAMDHVAAVLQQVRRDCE